MSGGCCSLSADARQIRGADASVRTEKLPEGPEWSVEPKLDGDRALAIKNYMNIWRLVPAAILLCAANAVLADTITILNPSFEANVLSCSAGPGCNTDNTLADWTGSTTDPVGFVSDILASGVFGAFKPGTGQYPAGVPDGVNVAFLITGAYVVSISQVLSATLKANDTYTLSGFVGMRDDTNILSPGLGCFGGYYASLEAGGTVLNSLDSEGNCPAPGTFRPFFRSLIRRARVP